MLTRFAVGVVAVTALGAVGALALWRHYAPKEDGTAAPGPAASSPAKASPAVTCERLPAPTHYLAGDNSTAGAFAPVLGRASFGRPVAVGVLYPGEGGMVAGLITATADAISEPTRLLRARGDLDPPRIVYTASGSFAAAITEPHAGGRSIRVASVDRTAKTTWTAEFFEGRDESLAIDILPCESKTLVAWDDLRPGEEKSRVLLASLDETLALAPSAPATPVTVDATAPRLLPRPGGAWLTMWILPETVEETGGGQATREGATLAVVPIDCSGNRVGERKAIENDVSSYDAVTGTDGSLLVAAREGATLRVLRVTTTSQTAITTLDEPWVATSEPALFPGWLIMTDLLGGVRVAPLHEQGLSAPPTLIPALELGQVAGAEGNNLLFSFPKGTGLELQWARCASTASPG